MASNPVLFPVQQRDAFLLPFEEDDDGDPLYHLFFVMTDPAKHSDVLLVNISSVYAGAVHDSTCYVSLGDHPFLTRQSYVVYALANQVPLQQLQRKIAAGEIIHRPPPLDPAVFARIAIGFGAVAAGGSPLATPRARAFFQTYR